MAKTKANKAVPTLSGIDLGPAIESRPLPPGVRELFLPRLIGREAQSNLRGDRDERDRAHEVFRKWVVGLKTGALGTMTETQVEQDFYKGLMGALGYATNFDDAGRPWTMQPKWPIGGEGIVDAALGRFRADEAGKAVGEPAVLVEIKGATVDLDARRSGKESPVNQLWLIFDSCASVFDVSPLAMVRGSLRGRIPGATPDSVAP